MTDAPHTLTELDAARAWALAYNTGDSAPLEAILAPDVRHSSQWVFDSLEGLDDYLPYLRGKLATLRRVGLPNRCELAETRPYPRYPSPPRPCVVVWEQDELTCTVLFTVRDGAVAAIDICAIPPPGTCARSGELPGLES